jgi:hypothetical protein
MAETVLDGTSNENDAMKPNLRLTERNRGRVVNGAAKPTHRTGEPEAPASTSVLERFRRLKWNELVRLGDFVADEHRGFEPWEGPGGFRADAFVKPTYRRQERRPSGAKKLQ